MTDTHCSRISLAFALIVALGIRAGAQVTNGGFETGSLNGWTVAGTPVVRGASFGLGPIEGVFSALVTTDDSAVDAASLEAFSGIGAGALTAIQPSGGQGVTSGSAIQQAVSARAGDLLSFQYYFLSNQGPLTLNFNDFAFFAINGNVERLAQVNPDASVDNVDTVNPAFARASSLRRFERRIETTGTYTITLGVVDVGDDVIDSGLLVDSVTVQSAPEPGSGLLCFTILPALILLRRVQRTGE